MSYDDLLVVHGFKSITSTVLNEFIFDTDVIEAALAHVIGSEVRAAYNRAEYLEQRREIMQWWSDHIETSALSSLTINKI